MPEAASETPAESPPPVPLRRNHNFRMLWIGGGSSVLGVRTAVSAYPLLMLWSTGSAAHAGLVAFAALLPQLLLVLPAGALVDRWDRRRTLMVCDAVGLAGMASLVVALLLGKLYVGQVMLVAFLEGGAVIFYRIAERAVIRGAVPTGQLSEAFSQHQARGHAAGVLGQPLGAGLFSLARWAPFLAAAVTHTVALVTLLMMRHQPVESRTGTRRALRTEIAEGIAWVWRQRFLRAALLVISISNIAFQVMALALVVLVKEGGHPAYMVGLVGLLGGAGGITGAMTAAWVMRRIRLGPLLLLALAVWTALMASLAFVAHPVALGLVSAGTTWVGALLNVAAGVHQVKVTPDALQGRVSSVFALVTSGLNSLGALLGGVLLTWYGGARTMAGVAVCMAVVTLLALAAPTVRRAAD
ncbi:MFS transporter [Streptomyces clavuligerus]|uniref:MFS transporter n=1 Tax=Streptomyces clavuligerus TaxID=1901 RepID=UPI00020D90DC|nr:MFS transporter [Streptomyces clavuligerus]ANW17660.1 multidrug transporter [Streptomyces clavuligerus]WDN55633.1 MFS transporter [Streptomyces clavuligerus]